MEDRKDGKQSVLLQKVTERKCSVYLLARWTKLSYSVQQI